MKRKTLHRFNQPASTVRKKTRVRSKRREGNSVAFILALKQGAETLGYYVAEDQAVVNAFDDARVFHDKEIAEILAKSANDTWELPNGQSFVVIPC